MKREMKKKDIHAWRGILRHRKRKVYTLEVEALLFTISLNPSKNLVRLHSPAIIGHRTQKERSDHYLSTRVVTVLVLGSTCKPVENCLLNHPKSNIIMSLYSSATVHVVPILSSRTKLRTTILHHSCYFDCCPFLVLILLTPSPGVRTRGWG